MRSDLTNKDKLVRRVFNSVAEKYDLMNDMMSFGAHRLWKKEMLSILQPQPTEVLLDVAGGTGDIARAFLAKGGGRAIICDINHNMLVAGMCQRGSSEFLQLICGNGENIPFRDSAVDSCSIAFGIRNMSNMKRAISEALRVMKPMGKFVCLEFLNCDSSPFSKIYDMYSYKVIPTLGKLVADDDSAYRYLIESIRSFPKSREFINLLRECGLGMVTMHELFPPVAAIYWGYKV